MLKTISHTVACISIATFPSGSQIYLGIPEMMFSTSGELRGCGEPHATTSNPGLHPRQMTGRAGPPTAPSREVQFGSRGPGSVWR